MNESEEYELKEKLIKEINDIKEIYSYTGNRNTERMREIINLLEEIEKRKKLRMMSEEDLIDKVVELEKENESLHMALG